jgi:hypothetical protein
LLSSPSLVIALLSGSRPSAGLPASLLP